MFPNALYTHILKTQKNEKKKRDYINGTVSSQQAVLKTQNKIIIKMKKKKKQKANKKNGLLVGIMPIFLASTG